MRSGGGHLASSLRSWALTRRDLWSLSARWWDGRSWSTKLRRLVESGAPKTDFFLLLSTRGDLKNGSAVAGFVPWAVEEVEDSGRSEDGKDIG